MFTDVIISHNGTSHQVQTLIDTGASVCMMDSTYAVDSCNIILPESNATIWNTFKATKEIEATCCDIANQLAKEKTGLCENIDVEIDKYKTSLDFRFKNTKYPRMNSFLFKEKDFIDNYKKMYIYASKHCLKITSKIKAANFGCFRRLQY